MFSHMKETWLPRFGRLFGLVITLGLLLPGLGCGRGRSEWRGKIQVVDGVTIVKNPREGIWDSQGRTGISMTEVGRIGTMEGPEETVFADISDVAAGRRGDVYVGDGKLCEVRKFAGDGGYLLTFGKKGQGPGEFQSIKTVSVGPEGRIIVFDDMMQRLSEFSEDGTLLKVTRRLDETRWIGPTRVFRSGDRYVLFGGYAIFHKAEGGLELFHEFGPDGDPTASYIDYEFVDVREFEENSIGFFPGQCDFQNPDDICYAHYYYDNRILVYKDKQIARVIERESDIRKPYEIQVSRGSLPSFGRWTREFPVGPAGEGPLGFRRRAL